MTSLPTFEPAYDCSLFHGRARQTS